MPCHHILLFMLIISLSVTVTTEIIQVFEYEGKEVEVSCSYDEGYESYEKYLCRNDCGSEDVLIKTTEASKSKYSIRDDTNRRVFTTTISNLVQRDAGKYWCGLTRTGKDDYPGEVELKVMPDHCCHSSTQIQQYDGGSVSIRCPYESQYQNNLKYFCTGNQASTCLQQAVVTSNNKQNTRFSLTDDKVSSFNVTITNLTRTDSGSYLCGVQRNTGLDVFSAVDLEVKENACCNRSTKFKSYEGHSVSIRCPYESQYQKNLKYICRGNRPSTCLQQAVVTSNNKPNTRFNLTDDKVSSFTVTITNLTRTDSGSYLCGVHTNTGLDVFSAADLEVKENICCDSSTKFHHFEGGSVSIRCRYESQYQNNLKYICTGNRPSTCLQQAVVTSNNTQNTRFNLTDDKVSSFTVTIANLYRTDSGSYLCGVHRNTGLDVFSAVDLKVKEWCCVKSIKLSGTVGHPLTMHCPYPPQHGTNRKFLCKGDHHKNCTDMIQNSSGQTDVRFTLQDDVVSSSFLVVISELEAGDAGTYWCGSDPQWSLGNYTKIQLSLAGGALSAVVFIVPVVLLFPLILVPVVVYKCKRHKVKGAGAKVTTILKDVEKVIVESDVYENEDVARYSEQRKPKQQSARPQNDDDGAQQDPMYGNVNTTEDIYCNDFFSNKT